MKTPRNSTQQARLRTRIAATRADCHICGKPINYKLPTNHPQSYQLDHIVPLARGGSHTIDNAAAAHRECNSKKRARAYAPIVRRSKTLE